MKKKRILASLVSLTPGNPTDAQMIFLSRQKKNLNFGVAQTKRWSLYHIKFDSWAKTVHEHRAIYGGMG